MKYEAVIFDLFGTLIKNFPYADSNNILKRMALELSVPPDDFVKLWHDAFDERMKGIFKDYQTCIGHICQQLGVPVRDDKIELSANIRFEINKQEVLTPREEAVEVLSCLKTNGYKIGLLSDCSTETTLVWESSPLASLIDAPVFSCVEGLKKPDHNFYKIAVKRLAVNPAACIYVADGIGQELSSAAKLGMYAVQIIVPGEDDYDQYRDKWDGPVISSLKEVLTLIK